MRIRCLTRSTWKDRNGEARSTGKTTLCCPPPIRSPVSERSKSLGWWRASRFLSPYLVVFHPFVEQLTVFIHLDSFWRRLLSSESSTSISMLSRPSGTCQKVRKLCINPCISIVNPLRTDIHTYTLWSFYPWYSLRTWTICVLFDLFSSPFSLYNLFPVNCSFCWSVQLQFNTIHTYKHNLRPRPH